MPIGDVSGEFNNTITSSTFERLEGGSSQVVINIEGSATPGQTNGTVILQVPTPGALAGPSSFTGATFAANGEVIGWTGEGCWQQLDGEQKWRLRAINVGSNGQVLLSDGTLDLASRTLAGSLAEWT